MQEVVLQLTEDNNEDEYIVKLAPMSSKIKDTY